MHEQEGGREEKKLGHGEGVREKKYPCIRRDFQN